MSQALINNYKFFLDGDLAPGATSVAITNDLETDTVVELADPADLTLIDSLGTTIERMIVTATGGIMTIVYRGIPNKSPRTPSIGLQKTWYAGQQCFLTVFASHFPTLGSNNTWTGTQTFMNTVTFSGILNIGALGDLNVVGTSNPRPVVANEAARDALYTAPQNNDHVRVLSLNATQFYNSSTAQRESYGVGTPPPNASESVVGLVKVASTVSFKAGTDQSGGVYLMPKVSDILTAIANRISFGDGSDGDVIITTTVTLTRDMYYNNLTITSPGILNPNGYRIFVAGTLSGNGKIQRNGNAGGNAALSVKGTAATILNQGSLNAEAAPGDGGNAGQPGVAAVAGGAANPAYHTANGSNGGVGGVGTGSGGNGGALGAGGVSTRGSLYNIGFNPSTVFFALSGPASYTFPASTQYKSTGAAGGGGGGCDSAGGSPLGGGGGGGGGNGGFVRAAINIVNRTGTRELIGGKGGNGANGAGIGAGGGGGGGGGNGGILYLIYKTLTSIGTKTLTGGLGGTKGTGGGGWGGDGADGVNGSVGVSIEIAV